MSHGEKSKKKKVKIRTQNEKIVETDMDVYGTKPIKKQNQDETVQCKQSHELSVICF